MLTKSRIIAWRQCPKRLWLHAFRPELAATSADQKARFAMGDRVGAIARDLFAGGHLIGTLDREDALAETRVHLADTTKHPLFEPAFVAEGVLVRVDLLIPQGRAWRMVEVKSSSEVKDYQVEDAAVQHAVLSAAGIAVERTEVAVVDTAFRYPGGGDYRGLLRFEDISGVVSALEPQVRDWIHGAQHTVSGPEPDIAPGEQCSAPFDCPFIGHCVSPLDPKIYPVTVLPRATRLRQELLSEGFGDIRDVPEQRLSGPIQRRIRRVTISGVPELDPAASEQLSALAWPRYYVDFETMGDAIPLWSGTRPYQAVPFQWSCHVEEADGSLTHREFLDTSGNDPRERFIIGLLDACGTDGPILVWSAGFEKGRLKELAADHPAHAAPLRRLIDRLFDLLPVARNHYYHRDMRGSWSIKAVLPTIAPDLAYDALEVGDGGAAQRAYAELIDPETPPQRRESIAAALRHYCGRDTEAMVRVARYFEQRHPCSPSAHNTHAHVVEQSVTSQEPHDR